MSRGWTAKCVYAPLVAFATAASLSSKSHCFCQRKKPPPSISLTKHLLTQNNNGVIPILQETDRILVINKPHGIPHHSTQEEKGIISKIRDLQLSSQFPYQGRLYGVHRLDRVTSGILLLAKDKAAASELAAAFRDRNVVKYYSGISRQKPSKKKQGWIEGTMQRGRRKSWFLQRKTHGVNFAKTRFFTAGLGHLQQQSAIVDPAKTLIWFQPFTGRTHQLRVAAKSVGIPLAGDPVYRDKYTSPMNRTLLHATALHIPKPTTTRNTPHKQEESAFPEGLTIWCPPSFAECLWTADGVQRFEQLFNDFVRKHCDTPEILLAVQNATQSGTEVEND